MKNEQLPENSPNEEKTSTEARPRLCAGTKLISMTDFVLNQSMMKFKDSGRWDEARWDNSLKYANFLKKPVTLGMFIPCDQDNKPLKISDFQNQFGYVFDDFLHADYLSARHRVLFEGFEVKTKIAFNNGYDFVVDKNEIFYPFWHNPVTGWELSKGLKTIEDLIIYGLCVKLAACT